MSVNLSRLVKEEQRADQLEAQLRRQQTQAREQELRIHELQQQLSRMQTTLAVLQHQQSSPPSSDQEQDDGAGYSDDDDDDGSGASRSTSPSPPSRTCVRHHRSSDSLDESSSFNPPSMNFAKSKAPSSSRPPSAHQAKHARNTHEKKPERLAKADLARLTTALEPTTVQRWITDLIETFVDYSPDTAWLLAQPTPAARLAIERNPHLRPLDRWAARQALNTMQIDKPYVRLLLNASTPEAASARTSGVDLLAYIRERATFCSAETARIRIAQFEAKSYFGSSMDAATTHLQADELRNDYQALPPEKTATPNGLLKALLAKLPDSVAMPRTMLEDKLVEAEALGNQPPWTFDQLVNVIAQHILVAARRTAIGAQVNVVESKGKKGSDQGPRPDQKCPCCGQLGHRPRDCPTTCKQCKQRSCPGNYGSTCIVHAPQFPSHVLNALGKPIPPNVKTILQKVHEKKTSQPAQASSKSVNAIEATSLSSNNPHLWEVMQNDNGRTSNVLEAHEAQPEIIAQKIPFHIEPLKEACPTFKSIDGRVRSTPRMLMLDGGSNINLFHNRVVPNLGIPIPGAPVQVSGWSDSVAQSVLASYRIDLQIQMADGTMRRVTTEV